MIVVGDEVRAAISAKKAVVALESTIFSSLGLPTPANSEALARCTKAVREAGAVPALTAVVDGVIWAGVPDELVQRVLGASVKLAARDLGVASAQRLPVGVTTVGASLAIADKVGIEVFATGGIGGVHRGSEITGDISADLDAIARHGVTVVSAGAKAFLDLPRTLEYLETRSVPVIGWRTDHFPAFYTQSSGLEVPHRVDDARSAARVHAARRELGQGGVLLAVPIPSIAELDAQRVADAIEEGLHQVDLRQLFGPQVTPVILAEIEKATGGDSVDANLALAENNAGVAAQIALEIAQL